MKRCPDCKGKGGWLVPIFSMSWINPFLGNYYWIKCSRCKGKGEIND